MEENTHLKQENQNIKQKVAVGDLALEAQGNAIGQIAQVVLTQQSLLEHGVQLGDLTKANDQLCEENQKLRKENQELKEQVNQQAWEDHSLAWEVHRGSASYSLPYCKRFCICR